MTPRTRHRVFVIVTAVFGVGLGFGAFAFMSLTLPWLGIPDEREVHRVHDLAYGAQGGILLALPLLLQSVNPERKIAAMQTAVASVVGFVLGYSLGDPGWLILVPVAVVGILIWLHPARSELFRAGRVDPLLALMAMAAAVPLVIYAIDQAEIQRACVAGDQHCDEFHYAGMAALSFAIPLAGLVASLRSPGWRIAAWGTGAAAAVLGLSAILLPDHPSSVGTTWGSVALAGGVLFVAVAELGARRRAGRPAPA